MYKALEASLGDRLEHPDRLERRAAARRPHTERERERGRGGAARTWTEGDPRDLLGKEKKNRNAQNAIGVTRDSHPENCRNAWDRLAVRYSGREDGRRALGAWRPAR